ncbi:MAG TPA: alpha/beta hydrolase [Burkholderiales bacterium]|nr:alpha/beta hydrolase [Burkholderiales bacterium]
MTLSFNQELCEVRGCRITLKRCGSGPKLLYLHGANGAASVRPFMEELAKGFNVLVPEHPGFGGSDEPDWLDNIHDLAYFYLDFLEQLDLKDVLLVGASIGGWLALEIAVRDTSRIRALTAVGPLGIYVPGLKRGDLFLWSPEEKVRNLFFDQKIAEQMLAQPTTPEQIETEVKNQYTVARLAWEPRMFDPHLAKWLHRVRVPTQIIWGDSDRVLPAGYAADFKKLIPHARVDIVARCGHTPHVEKPQEFARLVREFAAKN